MPDGQTTSAPDQSTRERILAAARGHFCAHGFRSVTMQDLACELAMSKKTLYAAFPSKTDLLEAVLLSKIAALDADLDLISRPPAPHPRPVLLQLLHCLQRHSAELQPVLLRDLQRETPDLFARLQTRRQEILERHFTQVLGDGGPASLLRPGVSPRLLLEMLLASLQTINNPPLLQHLGLTPPAALTQILSILLDGALPTPQTQPSEATSKEVH